MSNNTTSWKQRLTTPVVIAIVLYILALGLRFGFIAQTQELPDFRTPTPGLDIRLHWEGAKHIRAHTPAPCFELMPPSAPFHPYFVALGQSLLGENLLHHRILRVVIGSLSSVLVFLVSLRLTRNRLASAVAALLVITLPSWIYFDSMLIKASMEIFMLSSIIWLVTRPPGSWKAYQFLALGLLLGLLISFLRFSQGGTVMYIVVISAYLLLRRSYGAMRYRLLVVVPMVLLMVGSQLGFKYREQVFGIPANNFLPVGGVHVRIGFQKGAIGSYHVLRRFPALPLGHTFFARMAAEAKNHRPMTPAEANQSYLDEVKEFIHEEPIETLRVLSRKLALFFNNFEPQGNHFLPDVQRRASLLRLPTVGYGGLVIAGFWGLIALWRERKRSALFLYGGLAGSVLIMNLMAFVTWRYRLHATLPLAVLSAPGLILMAQSIRNAFRRGPDQRPAVMSLARLLAATAVVAFVAFRPVLVNARVAMADTARRNMKQSMIAEKFNKDLAEINSKPQLTTRDMLKRAATYHCLGRYTDAFQQTAFIALNCPEEIEASRQYMVYLLWYGDYDAAVEYLTDMFKTDIARFQKVISSYGAFSPFWQGSDANLRLIVQALIRDIVLPRVKEEFVAWYPTRDVPQGLPADAAAGPDGQTRP